MKMRIGYLAKITALFGLLVSGAASGETITPIYQIGDTQGTFIQVPLTQDIYRYPLQPDLQNLLVLDAQQNPLPYRLVSVLPQALHTEPPVISARLLFFPIAVDATADTLRKLHSEKLQLEAGTLQLITSDKILDNKTPEFYLLDISKLGHGISSLRIDWDAQDGNQYLELELEATADLQHWVGLGRSTLVQIVQAQQSLKKNNIAVAIAKDEYQFLRLRVIRGADNLRLSAVTAEQVSGPAPAPTAIKERWSLAGDLAKLQTQVNPANSRSKTFAVAAWEFTRSESTPLDTVAIDFGQGTYGSSGRILSRNSEQQNWVLQYQGIFFNAQIGSQWQSSDPVNVSSKAAKYWRIELDESARSKLSPRLVFAWQPTALQIIVNDKPPFFLALSDVGNSSHSRQVFQQLAALSTPVWQPAALIALEVKPGTLVSGASKMDWSRYLFWAALLLAVLLLLIFSFKLFKQINGDTEKS